MEAATVDQSIVEKQVNSDPENIQDEKKCGIQNPSC